MKTVEHEFNKDSLVGEEVTLRYWGGFYTIYAIIPCTKCPKPEQKHFASYKNPLNYKQVMLCKNKQIFPSRYCGCRDWIFKLRRDNENNQ